MSVVCFTLLVCIVHGKWDHQWLQRSMVAEDLKMSAADGVIRLIKDLEDDDASRAMEMLPAEMSVEEKQKRLEVGQLYHLWRGHEYGVIAPGGVAVTHEKGKLPFFELPATVFEAVNALPDKEL